MRVHDDMGALVAARDFPTYVGNICGPSPWNALHDEPGLSDFTSECEDNDSTFANFAVMKINLSEPKQMFAYNVSLNGHLQPDEEYSLNYILTY